MPIPIDPQDMRRMFTYIPETGNLMRDGTSACVLQIDGDGRTAYMVWDGSRYLRAARVIYAIITGADPGDMLIDHKNGDTLNNRWSNLRVATPSQNSINKKRQSNNTSGFAGVYRCNNGFAFRVSVMGKRVFKCGFKTARDAAKERDSTAKKAHGEFFRSSVGKTP